MSLRVALWAVLALLVALVSPAGAVYQCFIVPNRPTAFYEQANLYSQDLQVITEAIMRTGVVGEGSECLVQAQASPNMTTRITTGCTIAQHGATATVTTGSMTHSAAHATLKRIDIVSANNVGTKIVTQGTPAASPEPPTIPQSGGFNNVFLATVYIPAGDTAIVSNQIIDKRACIPDPVAVGGSGTVTHSVGALTADRLVIGNGSADVEVLGSLGTTSTVLHGNAAGAPTFGAVVSADLNLTATTCTNQFVSALSSAAAGTCTTSTLAGAQHANQGTATTVLHGNAAGNPTWSGIAVADHTATGTPSSATFLRGDNTWATPAGAGTVTTTGSPASGNLAAFSGTTSVTNTNLTGDVTTTNTVATTIAANAVTTAKILDANVTYAKMQNVSAASRILCRGSAGGAGDVEECTIGSGLTLSGTGLTASGGGSGATLTTFATARPADSTVSLAMASLTTRNVSLFELPGSITVNQLSIYFTAVNLAGTLRLCLYSEDGATKLVDITITPATGVIAGAVGAVALTPGRYYVALGCATTCNVTAAAAPAPAVSTLFGANSPAGKKKWIGTVTHTSGTCNATLGTITGTNTAQPVLRGDN